ncbi:MAG: hypothetical protein IMZ53_04380 [Thermoplasmata archaeon]|nr:hypothetical protein [Thermoplasmata archaeon]
MNHESIVKRFFEGLGYHVEKISEANEEMPDFSIFDDISSYVLELKTKVPSKTESEERKQLLGSGEIHNIHELIIRKNRLSGIIKKAKNQLESYKEKEILRIVWLLAIGHLAEPRMLQFESTLYGLATLIDGANKRAVDCFFFHNGDFFRFREILDGAIVSTESEAKLLLNPLSPRYAQMKISSLPRHFREAVVDPIELEKNGKAFFVDSDVDRDDKETVLGYLREKYKSDDIVSLTTSYLSGTIIIPDITK